MRYLTGLWAQYLHQGLLWERDIRNRKYPYKHDPATDLPTWSWASVRGRVCFPGVFVNTAFYENGQFSFSDFTAPDPQVSGIVVTPSILLSKGIYPPDGLTYRRIGTLSITTAMPGTWRLQDDTYSKPIPPEITEWVNYLKESSVFPMSKRSNPLGEKTGIVKLI